MWFNQMGDSRTSTSLPPSLYDFLKMNEPTVTRSDPYSSMLRRAAVTVSSIIPLYITRYSSYRGQGNMQFMAVTVLESIVSDSRKFEPEEGHDIESFVWVLGYSLLTRLRSNPIPELSAEDQLQHSDEELKCYRDRLALGRIQLDLRFAQAFQDVSSQSIVGKREDLSPLNWIEHLSVAPFVFAYLSVPLRQALHDILAAFRSMAVAYLKGNNPWAPPPSVRITYEDLRGILAKALGELMDPKC